MVLVAMVAFVLVLATHVRHWTDPPDPQSARRQWFEGVFLARTGFDYRALRFKEQTHARGGAFVYMTSVVPSFIALGLSATDEPKAVFAGYRFIQWAAVGWLAGLMFVMMREHIGAISALLALVAWLTFPSVWAQLDCLNVEFLATAPALHATRALARGRVQWSAALGCLATLMKPTFVVNSLLLTVFLLVEWGLARGSNNDCRSTSADRRCMVAALAGQVIVLFLGGMDHDWCRDLFP